MTRGQNICLATITAPHGVRGLMKLVSHTEPAENFLHYGPLFDATGRQIALQLKGRTKGGFIVAAGDVADRDAAESLRGKKLFVARQALPEPADLDEFYHADLVGLGVESDAGQPLGMVKAVQNFGAGDMLEITLHQADGQVSGSGYVPFTRDAVPVVDLAAGRLRLSALGLRAL